MLVEVKWKMTRLFKFRKEHDERLRRKILAGFLCLIPARITIVLKAVKIVCWGKVPKSITEIKPSSMSNSRGHHLILVVSFSVFLLVCDWICFARAQRSQFQLWALSTQNPHKGPVFFCFFFSSHKSNLGILQRASLSHRLLYWCP